MGSSSTKPCLGPLPIVSNPLLSLPVTSTMLVDDFVILSLESTTPVTSISPSIKKSRKKLPAPLRSRVWHQAYDLPSGNCYMNNPCYCCSRIISFENWEAGHVLAAACGGTDTADNLRPLCCQCNRSMGNIHMREYIARVGFYESLGAKEFGVKR